MAFVWHVWCVYGVLVVYRCCKCLFVFCKCGVYVVIVVFVSTCNVDFCMAHALCHWCMYGFVVWHMGVCVI